MILQALAPKQFERERNHFLTGCGGKVVFKNRERAENSRLYQIKIGRRGYSAVEPYRCKFCGDWHLGHHRRAL